MSIANSTLERHARLKSGKPPVRKVKIRTVNDARRSKVAKRRAKERRNAEHEAARALAWTRAQGMCECGCDRPMDMHGEPSWPGYPEAHHVRYSPPKIIYLRRECHQRIEMQQFSYRHQPGRKYS